MGMVQYKERMHTSCAKWDGTKDKFGKEGILPLWVADMDFEVPRCVQEALQKYVAQGTFGYHLPDEGYFQAFINWEADRHGYQVKREWIRFAPGVVPAFNWFVQILTEENDAVLIQQPVYYPFKDAVVNNHRTLVNSPLIEENGKYRMDYADFEQKIIDNDVKLFILCSPHNPVGRVWKEEELKTVLDICKKHHVYVVADEIHQDIILGDHRQIPCGSVGDYDEILVTLTAASKTFNLAACQNSFVVIPNEEIRSKYDAHAEKIRITGGNAFGYIAVQAAYEQGQEWLEEVLTIIKQNFKYLKTTIEAELPKAHVYDLEGTYLAWVDIGAYAGADEIEEVVVQQCGLGVDFGSWFGGEAYAGFIRVNLATCPDNIKEAAARLVKVFSAD